MMKDEAKKMSRYGAYGVIVQNSRVLLTQKKSGPYQGRWGLPGGTIEFGETPEDALKREIQEETALLADGLELLTVISHFGEYLNHGETYQIHHTGIIYRIHSISELSHLAPEEEMKWMTIEDGIVPDELTPFATQVWSQKMIEVYHVCSNLQSLY
jgi:mutator protein MutT